MSEVKTVSPEELRREADRLEEEIRGERVRELIREFVSVQDRSRKNPDLAVRLAGIREATKIADACGDDVSWTFRGDVHAWIRNETERIVEEGLVSEGGQS